MCSIDGTGTLVWEGQDDQTLLGLVTQILTAVGTQPLGGDLTDEVLAESVTRLHELETMAAAEKLRRIAEIDAGKPGAALQAGVIGVGQAQVAAHTAKELRPDVREELDRLVTTDGAGLDRRQAQPPHRC
jgi:hypothetical protein